MCRVKPEVSSSKFSKSAVNDGINAPHFRTVLLLTPSVNITQLKDINTHSDRKFSDSFKYTDIYVALFI